MVATTRHSLPHQPSGASPSATRRSLADTDGREARRLVTNAHFEDKNQTNGTASLGTYHWRGAVYEITPDTPQEWIDQGEAEWANTLKKRERQKREREDGVRERAEEVAALKRKRDGDAVVVEAARKRKRSEEVAVERRRRKSGERRGKSEEAVERRKSAGMAVQHPPRRQSQAAERRKTVSATTVIPPRSRSGGGRSRDKESGSSTASSNIHVANPRSSSHHHPPTTTTTTTKSATKAPQRKEMRPPPTDPEHDLPDDPRSESDTSDIPTKRGTINLKDGAKTLSAIAKERRDNIAKGYCIAPILTREDEMQELAKNLYALAKTNDRVEVLKKWWDGQRKDGAFQRLIEIVKAIKADRTAIQPVADDVEGEEELRDFAESVGEVENVQVLLRDMAVEEEQLEKERRESALREGVEDVVMEEGATVLPTPESDQQPIPSNPNDSSIQATAGSLISNQPTPPASPHSSSPDADKPAILPILLPETDRGGNPLRWSLEMDPARLNNLKSRLKTKELRDPERAEYAIVEKRRLEGESKTQRRRRVRRELREVEGWTIIPDPNPEVQGGGDGEEMDGVEFEQQQQPDEAEEVEEEEEEQVVYEHEDDDVDEDETEEVMGEIQETPSFPSSSSSSSSSSSPRRRTTIPATTTMTKKRTSRDVDVVDWEAEGQAAASKVLGGRKGGAGRGMKGKGKGKGRVG